VKKILITTGCRSDEPWRQVLDISIPRFQKYAERHGYDFSSVWYGGMNVRFDHLFHHPDAFIDGVINYEVRKDFILWNRDRSVLAPNWLRYAWTIQLMETYDLVLYLDGDVVIGDFETDVASVLEDGKWMATPINGPSPDNAGPGGPICIVKTCEESKRFWWKMFLGQEWKRHPLWTDGVDLFALLGYTLSEPIHKYRETEYDQYFQVLPSEWMVWYQQNPSKVGNFYHVGGGNGNPLGKVAVMQRIIQEKGI
jgi:hypothetical protein